jgi:hypothetical protein
VRRLVAWHGSILTWASECSPSGRTAAAWLFSPFKPPRALAGLCVNVGVLVVFQFRPLSNTCAFNRARSAVAREGEATFCGALC